ARPRSGSVAAASAASTRRGRFFIAPDATPRPEPRRPRTLALVEHLLALAVSFPSVVYTVLLGVALVYWLLVIVGAAHLDGADGGLEGATKGAIEGAAKGLLDGADGGAEGADVHVGDHVGPLGAVAAALKLRSAPVTVVGSLVVFFAW